MKLNLCNVNLPNDCPPTERLQLQSLELRRLVTDLIWCYKIVFGHIDIDINDSLNIRPASRTRGHDYKLYKTHTAGTRRYFFSERVINAWNGLPIPRLISGL